MRHPPLPALFLFMSLPVAIHAACPAAPVGSTQDTLIRMKASGGVAGIGPAGNMVSNTQGALVFDSATNTLKLCDGTNWIEVAGGGGGTTVPTGTIWAFDLTACPSGWSEYTAARGRFLRGIDNGAGNDPDGTRAPGNAQADDFKGHQHSTVFRVGNNTEGMSWTDRGFGSETAATGRIINHSSSNYAAFHPQTGVAGGAETRPKNVAVLFCRKG